ncbi:MAG: hypothetical protein Ct9H300mP22_3010 [Gammaproteobacteria bacterium]|nr:MAG: hypothetical protein Ct9H300mP22_3010 [Gammaproteobacteria bacterium]
MTEPSVASSDATNISTRAVLEGDEWVISGEKFYISGAGDVRCKIMICMVVTDPDAPKHNRQSQILVPMETEGVEVVRPMTVFGKGRCAPMVICTSNFTMLEYQKAILFSVVAGDLRFRKED